MFTKRINAERQREETLNSNSLHELWIYIEIGPGHTAKPGRGGRQRADSDIEEPCFAPIVSPAVFDCDVGNFGVEVVADGKDCVVDGVCRFASVSVEDACFVEFEFVGHVVGHDSGTL